MGNNIVRDALVEKATISVYNTSIASLGWWFEPPPYLPAEDKKRLMAILSASITIFALQMDDSEYVATPKQIEGVLEASINLFNAHAPSHQLTIKQIIVGRQ